MTDDVIVAVTNVFQLLHRIAGVFGEVLPEVSRCRLFLYAECGPRRACHSSGRCASLQNSERRWLCRKRPPLFGPTSGRGQSTQVTQSPTRCRNGSGNEDGGRAIELQRTRRAASQAPVAPNACIQPKVVNG
ncbi:hypothetical protein MTO96_012017 [Rhipicephalus appendiculatus]